MKAELICARALNALRLVHLPTYVGLRFLVESAAVKQSGAWVENVLPHKALTRAKPRFTSSYRFKSFRHAAHKVEHRQFHIPSPITALTEALVLSWLGRSNAFRKSKFVYSYLWPAPDAAFNYAPYGDGYRARNNDIRGLLELDVQQHVLVSDISKFYPSIDRRILNERVEQRLAIASELPSTVADAARALFSHVQEPLQTGVATGPQISHVAGDLALAEVDRKMSEAFPGRYFRYVDDVVLVLKGRDVERARNLLNEAVSAEGLRIHPDKTVIEAAASWLKYGPHNQEGISEGSFESLKFFIKVFLFRYPQLERRLGDLLQTEGFGIPVERLAAATKSFSFIRRLRTFQRRGWGVAIRALFAINSLGDVLELAREARQKLRFDLEAHLHQPNDASAMRSKWWSQRLRYLGNRAMYLLPRNELGALGTALLRYGEMYETAHMLLAASSGDATKLLTLPGPAVSSVAQYAKQAEFTLSVETAPDVGAEILVESFGLLALADAQVIGMPNVGDISERQKEFLKFCDGSEPQGRSLHDLSYEDEVRTLQLGRKPPERLRVIAHRFSELEDPSFDALNVGGQYDEYHG